MFPRGMIMAQRFFWDRTVKQPVKTFLLTAGVALFLGGASNTTANVIVQDFFGSTNDLGDGTLTRHDAAGNTVLMGSGQHGPTLIGLDGLRAQFPDTSAEVWRAPGGQHAATWFFASASSDPFEPVTQGDENNLIAAGGADAGTGGHAAALLPVTAPTSAVMVSADMIPEGGDLRDWVAIGFSASIDPLNLTNNFENFGQVWLLLKMNATGLGATTWELRTNGMVGPSLSGNTTLTGNYIPMELTYDPIAHLVRGSISGVSTPTISYTAAGIDGVGMEALEHVSFGIADHFTVQSATSLNPNPPGDYNGDGKVDAADYTVWRNTLGSTSDFRADGTGPSGAPDHIIDRQDYNFWKQHYGEGAGSGTAVPEPATAFLTYLALIGIYMPRQRSLRALCF